MLRPLRVWSTGLVVIAAGMLVMTAAGAETSSFQGKKIDVIIGSSPGGGTDGTTRLIGRYLEKYLPGNPQIVYRNMPEGVGTKALNYVVALVKPDGLTWMGGAAITSIPSAAKTWRCSSTRRHIPAKNSPITLRP